MTFKYYKIAPLILTILILSGIIEWSVKSWVNPLILEHFHLGDHIRVPTTEALLALFFGVYNQKLWKLPVFNLMMKVPDMSGRYQGKIKYKWDGKNREKDCFIEITQTASKIKVNTYFSDGKYEKTISRSMIEDINHCEDGFFEIYLFYQNGGTKQNSKLDSHEGANCVRFHPGKNGVGNTLNGYYYTNRQIQTRGEIEGFLVSKNLHGKF